MERVVAVLIELGDLATYAINGREPGAN